MPQSIDLYDSSGWIVGCVTLLGLPHKAPRLEGGDGGEGALTRHLFGHKSKIQVQAGQVSPKASVPGLPVSPSRPVLSGSFL